MIEQYFSSEDEDVRVATTQDGNEYQFGGADSNVLQPMGGYQF